MNNIEQFIRDHAGMLDDQEPAQGHFERFEERLERFHSQPVRHPRIRLWMKIAAGLLIFITAGLTIFELATRDFSGRNTLQRTAVGLPDELIEILAVYETRAGQQMVELNRMAMACPGNQGLIRQTSEVVSRLDRDMEELVTALKDNPTDSRVQTALIRNCKAKESVLNDLILNEKIKKCE